MLNFNMVSDIGSEVSSTLKLSCMNNNNIHSNMAYQYLCKIFHEKIGLFFISSCIKFALAMLKSNLHHWHRIFVLIFYFLVHKPNELHWLIAQLIIIIFKDLDLYFIFVYTNQMSCTHSLIDHSINNYNL